MDDKQMEEFVQAFGQRLREIRKGKEMTQEDVASRASMELRQYGRIERGEINTTINTVRRLAEALEVTPAQLFEFTV